MEVSRRQIALTARDQEFLRRLLEVIREKYSIETFGAEELARDMALSRSQLHRKLAEVTGLSAGKLIRQFRLKKAYEVLREGTLTAAEVGYQVGFGSPSYFNKSFHDYFGFPPGETHSHGTRTLDVTEDPDLEALVNQLDRSQPDALGDRHLAAVMFTDIEGYTALMQQDETRALEVRNRHREIFQYLTLKFKGRILQYYGDGTLSTFDSAIDAVKCGIDLQLAFLQAPMIPVRIGIHTGDIIFSKEDIIGDGVNVASRVESLAKPGSVLISGKVYDEVKNQAGIHSTSLGSFELKNVDKPVEVFAVTNPGLVVPGKDELAGKVKSDLPIDGRRKKTFTVSMRWALVAVMALLAGYLAYTTQVYQFVFPPTSSSTAGVDRKSIAVLPFKTIGGDPDGAYFAEGVREEILNHLTRIEDLHVKSRTVVDRLQNQTVTTRDLVSQLKLTHYLQGSARKVGGQVRITVQFIDAQTDEQLWAENYDREYSNIWGTQSEIAQKVADVLSVRISPEVARIIEKKPTSNPEAWDDFLKALYYLRSYYAMINAEDPGYLQAGAEVIRYLKASIRKDSTFALGYSMLGAAYREIKPDSAMLLIRKAIDLDPDLSTPYVFRAEYHVYVDHDTAAAVRDYHRAIVQGPHTAVPYWHYASYQRARGELDSALILSFQALQRQPEPFLAARILYFIGLDYLHVADYQKAEYYLDRALVMEPDNLTFLLRKAHLYRVTGQYDLLFKQAQRITDISPSERGPFEMGMYYLQIKDYQRSVEYFARYFTDESKIGAYSDSHMYGYALLKTGRSGEANNWFQNMQDLMRNYDHRTAEYEFAKIYSAKGMVDSAYYHLERAVAEPLPWGLADFMERDPLFENIQQDQRFLLLVKEAKEKVRKKREGIRALEVSGEIPTSLEGIELI